MNCRARESNQEHPLDDSWHSQTSGTKNNQPEIAPFRTFRLDDTGWPFKANNKDSFLQDFATLSGNSATRTANELKLVVAFPEMPLVGFAAAMIVRQNKGS